MHCIHSENRCVSTKVQIIFTNKLLDQCADMLLIVNILIFHHTKWYREEVIKVNEKERE